MDVENVKKFTKDELVEKADAALGKVVKTTKTFSMDTRNHIRRQSHLSSHLLELNMNHHSSDGIT